MERTTFGMTFYIRRTKLDKTGKAPFFAYHNERSACRYEYQVSHIPTTLEYSQGPCPRKQPRRQEGESYARSRRFQYHAGASSTEIRRSSCFGPKHTVPLSWERRTPTPIDFAPTTVQRYESLFRITAEFLRAKYGQDDFYLDDLPEQLIEDYEFYMKTDRRCAHNKDIIEK